MFVQKLKNGLSDFLALAENPSASGLVYFNKYFHIYGYFIY